MQGESALLLAALFALAAAAGWYGARMFRPRSDEISRSAVNPDYVRGLRYLLDEQPDKALEMFLKMVDVDGDTLETHFELAALFRRRGEVDRAIRIHQNLIARPNLSRVQRDQALFGLAEDYLKAGLLDRAEKLFEQLGNVPAHRIAALEHLVSIYELQRDWQQAIEVRSRLQQVQPAGQVEAIGHGYCELATLALAEQDSNTAKAWLKKAHSGGRRRLARGAIMRAEIARRQDDSRTAIRLIRRVIEMDPSLTAHLLPLLQSCFESPESPELSKLLDGLLRKQPLARNQIACAAIVNNDLANPVVRACVQEYLRGNQRLQTVLARLGIDSDSDGVEVQVAAALRELAGGKLVYRCRNCGYAARNMNWQCPSCKRWDTLRPDAEFRLETLLHDGPISLPTP